ncbi:probable 28S ribosomal protein S16, mitochondrial [Osmia bicornis bicornis]|uniref:probable 28S ribosomal protein S16, mitochondrial n=1 Tax=Osmia bicornis bicornis TaxID=1437191 RepID=UPI0010F48725|nr:probable 28S ribosomal protein S16, mitochondrial [Osmia bicornis bicornis]
MPRLPLHPSSGTGIVNIFAKSIRFVRYGCANRPFYHIVVMDTKQQQHKPPIEQLGTYDPLPNKYNEKIVALNFERLQYWLGKGADISKPVAAILGIAGYLPIHPKTYLRAWRNRRKASEESNSNTNSVAESGG